MNGVRINYTKFKGGGKGGGVRDDRTLAITFTLKEDTAISRILIDTPSYNDLNIPGCRLSITNKANQVVFVTDVLKQKEKGQAKYTFGPVWYTTRNGK